MSAGRKVWVKIRASEAERSEWHAKARGVGARERQRGPERDFGPSR